MVTIFFCRFPIVKWDRLIRKEGMFHSPLMSFKVMQILRPTCFSGIFTSHAIYRHFMPLSLFIKIICPRFPDRFSMLSREADRLVNLSWASQSEMAPPKPCGRLRTIFIFLHRRQPKRTLLSVTQTQPFDVRGVVWYKKTKLSWTPFPARPTPLPRWRVVQKHSGWQYFLIKELYLRYLIACVKLSVFLKNIWRGVRKNSTWPMFSNQGHLVILGKYTTAWWLDA